MKTLADYHKQVLGVSLNGKSGGLEKESMETPQQNSAEAFCFLCRREDFNKNKELVLKILAAAGSNQNIIVFEESETENYLEIFSFDSPKEKALNFESFSNISVSPDLKKNLWAELKKRIVSI